MKTLLSLPSGKIVNLTRFVALIPLTETLNNSYELLLEGSFQPIFLEEEDVKMLIQKLKLNSNFQIDRTWNKEEQLHKNKVAMKLLKEWIETDKNQQSIEENCQNFEEFKKIIDAERPAGQKLYLTE